MRDNKLAIRLAAFFLICGWLPAQQSYGYVFAGAGGISTVGQTGKVLYGGAGAEAIVGSGMGLGAEAGAIRQVSRGWHGLLGLVSTNFYYHFVHSLDRTDPFVTVGYSSAFRGAHREAGQDGGQANLINFGGGVNYWFRPRTGVKLEFRDHLRPKRGPNADYWSFRFGLTFALR
jgi:hypothetical protein